MPAVDPSDDSVGRFVISHYRFDNDRGERRNVVIGAFDNEHEFRVEMAKRSEELRHQKAAGSAEAVEHISGGHLPPGHAAAQELRRAGWKALGLGRRRARQRRRPHS